MENRVTKVLISYVQIVTLLRKSLGAAYTKGFPDAFLMKKRFEASHSLQLRRKRSLVKNNVFKKFMFSESENRHGKNKSSK